MDRYKITTRTDSASPGAPHQVVITEVEPRGPSYTLLVASLATDADATALAEALNHPSVLVQGGAQVELIDSLIAAQLLAQRFIEYKPNDANSRTTAHFTLAGMLGTDRWAKTWAEVDTAFCRLCRIRLPADNSGRRFFCSDACCDEAVSAPHSGDAWNQRGLTQLVAVLEEPLLWIAQQSLKYLDLRIDTRDRGFILKDRTGEVIDPVRVFAAAERAGRKARRTSQQKGADDP